MWWLELQLLLAFVGNFSVVCGGVKDYGRTVLDEEAFRSVIPLLVRYYYATVKAFYPASSPFCPGCCFSCAKIVIQECEHDQEDQEECRPGPSATAVHGVGNDGGNWWSSGFFVERHGFVHARARQARASVTSFIRACRYSQPGI